MATLGAGLSPASRQPRLPGSRVRAARRQCNERNLTTVKSTQRARVAAVAAVLASPLLSSCGFGFGAQTNQPYNPATGVNDRSGMVNVLNAMVVSGSQGSGTVVAALVNQNQNRPDRLTGLTGAKNDQGVTGKINGRVTIPPGGAYQLATSGNVTVTGSSIRAGYFVNLTFNFKNAASVTVDVPVVEHTGDYAKVPLPSVG
jgi:copper(I)-binding protein